MVTVSGVKLRPHIAESLMALSEQRRTAKEIAADEGVRPEAIYMRRMRLRRKILQAEAEGARRRVFLQTTVNENSVGINPN